MRHISPFEVWYRIATPQEETLRKSLGAESLRETERSATVILTLFPIGGLALWSPNLPVVLLCVGMWLMLCVALHHNRQGRRDVASYWTLSAIHLVFYTLFWVSNTGVLGIFYLSVFLLVGGMCSFLLPRPKYIYYLMGWNCIYYAGCLFFFSRSGIFAYAHLVYGWVCFSVLIMVLLYLHYKDRNCERQQHSLAEREIDFERDRADRYAAQWRTLLKQRSQEE